MIDSPQEEKNRILEEIAEQIQQAKGWMQVHILSFCMKVSGNARFAEELLNVILKADADEVGEYNKLSHFWQISTAIFLNHDLCTTLVEERLAKLYTELFWIFAKSYGLTGRQYIPMQERNKNLVFVFTSQVLGMEHAPTKTLLDRCYVLKKYLHKEVFIINTAMQVTIKGMAPFYKMVEASYAENLCQLQKIEFKGEEFGFYQCENKMPDLEIMADIIRKVKVCKPAFLLVIGGSDICADLCGMFIPEITVSTVFSEIAYSCGEYQIVDKDLSEEDKRVLDIMGVELENVKRAMFTFSFKEQTHIFTKKELGLWQDKFILIVVGWRLDTEIDGKFLNMLEHVVRENQGIGVAFMGVFDTWREQLKEYPALEKNSHYLGKQMDALAVLECCNLYVNPKRSGGGSSVSEALYKGLPAVTLPVGDVSVAAGENFGVTDYEMMEKQILRYASEPDYYNRMAQYARERAGQLLDSNCGFGEAIKKIEKEIILSPQAF